MTEEIKKDPIAELTADCDVQAFDARLVDSETIEQMIMSHQLSYVEQLIQAEEEKKLFVENVKDFLALDEAVQSAALKHCDGASVDPEYFKRNGVDEALRKPIMIAAIIKAKREEAKIKTWKVVYHGRLIERLRIFKKQCEAHEQAVARQSEPVKEPTFWDKFIGIFCQEEDDHTA